MSNYEDGTISGGTYSAKIYNYGTIVGGTFTDEIVNSGTIQTAKITGTFIGTYPKNVIHKVNGKDTALAYGAALPEALGTAGAGKVWCGSNGLPLSGGSVPWKYTSYTAKTQYAVSVGAMENGTVSADKAMAVQGETITLTVAPATGYALSSLSYTDGSGTTTNIDGTSFTMPEGNVTVNAAFEMVDYRITVTAGENGKAEAQATANYGEAVALTVTPAEGYELESLTVDGEDVTAQVEDGVYTFTMPAGDVTAAASFKAIVYGITVSESENGAVAADKSAAIIGEKVTLTITPAQDYALAALTVNGEDVTAKVSGGVYTFTMPASDVTVAATFKVNVFGITVSESENGKIEVPAKATVGEQVTLTIAPAEDYALESLTVGGEDVTAQVSGGAYTFTMPEGNVTVAATFKVNAFGITVSSAIGGTVEAPAKATFGNQVTLTVVPAEGYELESLTVDGVDVTARVKDGAYTFTMPASDVTVAVSFTGNEYRIYVSNTTGGVIKAPEKAAVGEQVTPTFDLNYGYELDTLIVVDAEGNNVPVVDGVFTMPASYVTVSATYSAILYTVTIAETVGGKVTADKYTTTWGEVVTLTVVPDAGYELAGYIRVQKDNGGGSVATKVEGTDNQYSFFNMDNTTVIATFKKVFNITIDENMVNGSVTVDKATAVEGDAMTLTVTPAEGYELDTLTVTGADVYGMDTANGVYGFNMPASDVTVSATFKEIAFYNVTLAETTNGTVTFAEGFTNPAKSGEWFYLTITPDPDYSRDKVTITGESGETYPLDSDSRFMMPEEDVTVSVTFKSNLCTVTIAETVGGTVTADKYITAQGEKVILTVIPDAGYELDGYISVNSDTAGGFAATKVEGTENQYSYFNMGNTTVTATFRATEAAKAQITGVLLTVDGVEYTSGNVTIRPESTVFMTVIGTNLQNSTGDNHLIYASGKGIYVNNDYGFTFGGDGTTATKTMNVMEFVNCSGFEIQYSNSNTADGVHTGSGIYLTYDNSAQEPQTYTIAIADDITNGTVEADKATATEGETVTLTVTPAAGYELDTLTVLDAADDDVLVADGVFTMPASDVTVSATFAYLYPVRIADFVYGELVPDKATAAAGEIVTLTAFPPEGYEVEKIDVGSPDGVYRPVVTPVEGEENRFTFVMPESEVSAVVYFKEKTYKITVEKTENGTVVCGESAVYGEVVSVGYDPDTGCMFDTLIVTDKDGEPVPLNAHNRFTMPASDVTVKVMFKKVIDAAKAFVGERELTDGAMVKNGETITVKPYLDGAETDVYLSVEWYDSTEGALLTDIENLSYTVDESEIPSDILVLRAMDGAHQEWLTLMLHVGEGVSFTVNGSEMIAPEGTQFLTWAAESYNGYGFVLRRNGAVTEITGDTVIEDGDSYSTAWFIEDRTLKIFDACSAASLPAGEFYDDYAIESGSVTVTHSVNGADETFTLTGGSCTLSEALISKEYDVNESWLADGEAVDLNAKMPLTYTVYTIGETTYTVAIADDITNGTVEADKATAAEGETVTLTVTPAAEFELDALTVMQGENTIEYSEENGSYSFTMPAGNVTVSATFKEKASEVTVTIIDQDGNVLSDGDTVNVGDELSVSVTGLAGEWIDHFVDGWYKSYGKSLTVPGGTVLTIYVYDNVDDYYSSNIENAAEVIALNIVGGSAQETYTVTLAETENGTVSFKNGYSSPTMPGDWFYLNIEPDEGWELFVATVTGESGKVYSFDYYDNSFPMPEENVTVSVTFREAGSAAETYTITFAETTNGTVSFKSGDSSPAAPGTQIFPNIQPDEGYKLDEVTVTGESGTKYGFNDSYGYFSVPNENVTVSATFKAKIYTIAVQPSENGSVIANETARTDETVTLTVTPNEGYELDALTVKQGENTIEHSEENGSYSFTMPAGNVTVSATFKAKTYTIAVQPSENGSVTANETARTGETVTLTVTPDEGYELDTLTVLDAADDDVPVADGVFTMPASDVTVSATFKEKIPVTYTMMEMDANYMWVPCDGTVPAGGTVSVTASVESIFYCLWYLDGERIADGVISSSETLPSDAAGKTITCYVVSEADWTAGSIANPIATLSAAVSAPIYKITFPSMSVNGSVTTDKTTAAEGETVTLTVTPAAGFELATLTVRQGENTIEYSKENGSYSFTMPAGNVTVSATFKRVTRGVTITDQDGNVLSGGDTVNVGDELSVRVTGMAGEWIQYFVNNGYEGSGNSLTVPEGLSLAIYVYDNENDYTASNTQYAYWGIVLTIVDPAQPTYTVTLAETENGTVSFKNGYSSPTRPNNWFRLDIQPDEGWELFAATVTGESGKVYSFDYSDNSFWMPEENVTVSVAFREAGSAAEEYTVTFARTENGTVSFESGDSNPVVPGTQLYLDIQPDEGYELNEVTITGESGTKYGFFDSRGYFIVPNENVTVSATFKEKEPEVDYTKMTFKVFSGETELADGSTVRNGDALTLKILNEDGTAYTGDDLKIEWYNYGSDGSYLSETTAYTVNAEDIPSGLLYVNVFDPNSNCLLDLYLSVEESGEPEIDYTEMTFKVFSGETELSNGASIKDGDTLTLKAYTADGEAFTDVLDIDWYDQSSPSTYLSDNVYTHIVKADDLPSGVLCLGVYDPNGQRIFGAEYALEGSEPTDLNVTSDGELLERDAEVYDGSELVASYGTEDVTFKWSAYDGTDEVEISTGASLTVTKEIAGKYEILYVSVYRDLERVDSFAVRPYVGYTVNIDATIENGTVAFAEGSANPVRAEKWFYLDIEPADGYELDEVIITGESGATYSDNFIISDNSFLMPAENVTVSAMFKEAVNDFAVILVQPENGSVDADSSMAPVGETVRVQAMPYGGYTVDRVTVTPAEGEPVEVKTEDAEEGWYSFVMPRADVTVSAVFKAKEYAVNLEPGEHGSIRCGKETAAYGETVTIEVIPDEGYKLDKLDVFNEALGEFVETDGTSFTMPAGDVIVIPWFKAKTYTITIQPSEHGTVTVQSNTAETGETVTLTVTEEAGYAIKSLTVTDEAGETVFAYDGSGTSFTMPAGNVTVTAEFEQGYEVDGLKLIVDKRITSLPDTDFYAIEVTETGELALSGDTQVSVKVDNYGKISGGTYGTVENYYEITSGTFRSNVINRDSGTITGGTFSGFVRNAGNIDAAKFVEGAQVNNLQPYNVIHCLDGEDKAIPYNGGIAALPDALGEPPTGKVWLESDYSQYTYVPLIYTSFGAEWIDYEIEITHGEGGSVSVEPNTAHYGEDIALNVQPDTGYEVYEFVVMQGENTIEHSEEDGNYSFTMPAGDVNITATFRQKRYWVNTEWNEGGSVSVTPEEATFGETVQITVKVDEGSELASLTVTDETGSEIPLNDDNTFTMPAGDVNVKAEFTIHWAIRDNVLAIVGKVDTLPEGEYTEIYIERTGELAGGTTDKNVTNEGTISGGTFSGFVDNRNEITGGTFSGNMNNDGTVSGAKFTEGAGIGGNQPTTVIHNVDGEDKAMAYDENLLEALGNPGEGKEWVRDGEPVGEGDSVPLHYTVYTLREKVTEEETYFVYIWQNEGGTVTADRTEGIKAGETVNLTVTTNAGSEFVRPSVTWNGNFIAVTQTNGGYSFTMPEGSVEVEAMFNVIWLIDEYGNLVVRGTLSEMPNAEFTGDIIVEKDAELSGGTFDKRVNNFGTISGGTFSGFIQNEGAITGGTFSGGTVNSGTITGAKYTGEASVDNDQPTTVIHNVDGEDKAMAYGENLLAELAKIKTLAENEVWVCGDTKVSASDSVPLIYTSYISVEETYSVTIADIENGTVEASKTEGIKAGETVTITVTPAEGYEIESINVESTAQVGELTQTESGFTFTMPAGDVAIKATFKQKTYSVTIAEGIIGGTATADKAQAKAGETVTITVTANDGYHLNGISAVDASGNTCPILIVTDLDTGEIIGYAFGMPASNVTVIAQFSVKTDYAVLVTPTTNGSVAVDHENAAADERITFTVAPEDGYELDVLKVTDAAGKEVGVIEVTETATGNVYYAFIMPAGNVTVTVTFKQKIYSVTIADGIIGGTTTADKAQAKAGETVTLTVTPAEGYALESINAESTAQGGELTPTEGGFTFTMPEGDVTVTATFRQTATAAQITGVSLIVDGVEYTSGHVTITPESAVTLKVTGTNLKNTTDDHVVLYKNGLQTVVGDDWFSISEDGTTATRTMQGSKFKPSNEHEIAYCNTFRTGDKTYTGTGIFVTYSETAEETYSVTIAEGITGGTVTADKAQAKAGETVTITVTPAEGYALEGISATYGEGKAVAVSANNQFTMPEGDVNVTATFIPLEPSYVITIPAGVSLTDGPATLTVTLDELANLPEGKAIGVRVDSANDLKMVSGSESIAYTITNGTQQLADDFMIQFVSEGSVALTLEAESTEGKPAGEYADTITFTASIGEEIKQSE